MNPLSVERKYVRRTPFLDRISGKRSPFERSSLFQALKGGVHSKSRAYLIYSTFVRNSKELFIQSVYGFSAFLNLIESNTSVFPCIISFRRLSFCASIISFLSSFSWSLFIILCFLKKVGYLRIDGGSFNMLTPFPPGCCRKSEQSLQTDLHFSNSSYSVSIHDIDKTTRSMVVTAE